MGAVVLAVAFIGPFVAPLSPTAIGAIPFSEPSPGHPLGTDYLGQDVFSRVLYGGWRLLLVAVATTVVAYLLGSFLGLLAAVSRPGADSLIMRSVDVLLAFPPILFVLILAAGIGPGWGTIIIGTIVLHVPGISRVVRTASQEILAHGYVEAARSRGDSFVQIVRREVLPNIRGVILADSGPRLTVSIFLLASLNFLGVGVPPGDPDWAAMINENRSGLSLVPWGVVAPAVLIAMITLAVNSVADSFSVSLTPSSGQELRVK